MRTPGNWRVPSRPTRISAATWALAGLPYVSLLGLLSLVMNAALSFEDPHMGLLLVSGLLVATAPAGVLVHLAITTDLTRAQKRAWIGGLMGRRAMALFAAYFEPDDRRAATVQLGQ